MSNSPASEKILVVGAGAVGLVYGRHLQRAGCDVTYYIRDKYRAQAQAGYPMYPLNTGGRDKPVVFDKFGIVTSAEQVAEAGPFTQVWLCVSSPGLRGEWLPPILRGAGDDASVVLLTNGLFDRALIGAVTGDERICQGIISMISYQGPLPTESLPEPGCVYWFPPMGPSPFSGTAKRVKAIVENLKRGGCPAKSHPDVAAVVGFPTAVFMPLLLALEAASWTFDGLGKGDGLQRAVGASKEAIASVKARTGHTPPFGMRFNSPMAVRLLLKLAPIVIPLPLETYLAYHFTKVGEQTRMYVREYIQTATDNGLPSDNLRELLNRLPAPDAAT
jgi:hypothetical protein